MLREQAPAATGWVTCAPPTAVYRAARLAYAPRGDGTRAVTVTLPAHSSHSFRYLAAGGHWFGDEHADSHDGTNSRIHT
ncbi:hypothetical protein [Streptomyces sp. NBC_01006]|uniref:hypothetical protein n=1 Tax=Streptomyces sp. NBC_01006 TaxID=2903716 RepID=UPI00386D4F62|nr:hypothetical protein OG509_38940 [Streptomyces sp. NBC_01006]